MIRKFGMTIITLAILSSGIALGKVTALEEVAELNVSGITLPAGTAGQVVYRKCSGCEPAIWIVDAATTYYLGTKTVAVSLADLQQAVASDQYQLIYVHYVPNSDRVTRIVLDLNQVEDE